MTDQCRVVVSGYYGFGNAGDEAVLYALLRALREEQADITVVVLSNKPEITAACYGVAAVNRWSPVDVWRELRSANLLLSGGGSLLQNATGLRSLLYYLGVLVLARLAGCPTAIYAQGIGPLQGWIARRLTALVLNKAQGITVRDQGSRVELAGLGVKQPVHVTVDPVLGLNFREEDLSDLQSGLLPPGEGPVAIWALRSWQDNHWLAAAAQAAQQQLDHGWRLVVLPLHWPEDASIGQQLVRQLTGPVTITDSPLSLEQLLPLVGSADLVVGMRLHALIFAALVGVPMVGLSYDPKVERFLTATGQVNAGLVGELTTDRLTAAIEQATVIYQDLQLRLIQDRPTWQQLARETARLCLSAAKKKKKY